MPGLGLKTRCWLAFLFGAITTLAFAPFHLSPLAWLATAGLFLLWYGVGPRAALLIGWLYGLGLLGTGVSWLHISINQFGNVGLVFALCITFLFILAMALYYGLAGWLGEGFTPRSGVLRLMFWYPALWVLLEWTRGWLFTGFPWLALGYSQMGWPLAAYAPVLGVYGASLAVALSAGALASLLVQRERRSALALLTALWGGGALLLDHPWTQPAGESLKIAIVQGNVPQTLKWNKAQLRPTEELYLALTRRVWGSDFIIWPETAIPALYSQVDKSFLEPLEREALAEGSRVLLGIPHYDQVEDSFYNAYLALGEPRDLYFKRHLVPFGEFLPFKPLFGPLLDWIQIPMSDFSRGEAARPLLQAGRWRLGVSICYEDAFGEEVIQALPEADFLVNASNDGWFGDSLAPHQHLQMARMRALESGRWMLRATNTGISAVIDQFGRVVGRSPSFQVHVLRAEVPPMQGLTPYARWGNWVVISGLALGLSLFWMFSRRARGQ